MNLTKAEVDLLKMIINRGYSVMIHETERNLHDNFRKAMYKFYEVTKEIK